MKSSIDLTAPSPGLSRKCLLVLGCWLGCAAFLYAHDIPNARVDRSIQATVRPGELIVDYEVGISELTLTQELRSLIGSLEGDGAGGGGDREAWFNRYGNETGPLNAKGLLVEVDGKPLRLSFRGFDLTVEEHPRYVFHFSTSLPDHGRLAIRDTNFVSSEGTSRLAIRGGDGIGLRGDDLPQNAEEIAIRPVWQLSDSEEKRTKYVVVDFARSLGSSAVHSEMQDRRKLAPAAPTNPKRRPYHALPPAWTSLTWLLDSNPGISTYALLLIAFALGIVHSFQPGHGKTLISAATLGGDRKPFRSFLLALATTLVHFASVLVVVLILRATRTTKYDSIHRPLAQIAGFVIAVVGVWRLGRYLGGYELSSEHLIPAANGRGRNVLALGVAGGLVPCWEAVVLILVADAVGRLMFGLLLLVAFSLGMIVVLLAVALATAWLGERMTQKSRFGAWEYRFGVGSAVVLTVLGLGLLQ